MAKRNYLNIEDDEFQLTFADAKQTVKNIERVFLARASWFSTPKPIPIAILESEYHHLCPDMDTLFPGVVGKMLKPAVLRQLGFPVTADGMVHWSE